MVISLAATGCALVFPPSSGVYETLYTSGTADVMADHPATGGERLVLDLIDRSGCLDEVMGVSARWGNADGWTFAIEGPVGDLPDPGRAADISLRSPDGAVALGTIGRECRLTLHDNPSVALRGEGSCLGLRFDPPIGKVDGAFDMSFRIQAE